MLFYDLRLDFRAKERVTCKDRTDDRTRENGFSRLIVLMFSLNDCGFSKFVSFREIVLCVIFLR